MNETCDWCGPAVRAVYRAGRHGELYRPAGAPRPRNAPIAASTRHHRQPALAKPWVRNNHPPAARRRLTELFAALLHESLQDGAAL